MRHSSWQWQTVTAKTLRKKYCKCLDCFSLEEHSPNILSYIIERLPEGGEGLGVYDDGEGDD